METKSYIVEKISDYGYRMDINNKNNNEYTNIMASMMKKMIKNSFFDYEATSIYFTCESIMTLSCYVKHHHFKIPYDKCLIMIDNLTQQMNYLKTYNYGFYGFDMDDIIVIDNTVFIFAGTSHLQNLINDSIFFYTPINIPYFFNPELINIDCLPSEINYKACYYSLGVLVVYSLFNNYLLVGNEIKNDLDIESILKPIYNTKLYWFLKRCLLNPVDFILI